MALRLKTRGTARRSTVRSTRALLSFAVAAGLAVPAATAVAAPSDSASSAEDQTAEAYLADLVGTVSSTEGEVSSLELELGGLRESVNKARVDVDRSQRAAQEAQDNVTEARSRLDGSDSEVKDAQSTLDELARSAYTRGGDSAPIALASGSDATGDTIDRATYMRMAAEKQQSDIDKLDLARTQAANEESSLRVSRDDADGLVTAARDAHSSAQKAYTDAQSTISEKSAELERVKNTLSDAQSRLAAAKKAVDKVSENAGASSFDKRRAAEAAVDNVESTPTVDTKVDVDDGNGESDEVAGPVAPLADEAPEEAAEEVTEDAEVATDEATGEEAVTEEPLDDELVDDVPEETDEADEAAEIPDIESIPGSFEGSTEGDALRQAAIDGLIGAAGDAAYAGINSHLSGDPDGALEAAANAGRESAANAYANLPAGTEGAEGTEGVEGAEGIEGEEGILPEINPGEGEQPAEPDSSGTSEEQIERVIERGMGQLGVTYAWGGGNADGPTMGVRDGGVADSHGDYSKVGFDCSGLMVYSFAAAGIQLEKYSGYQYTSGNQVPVGDAKRGDMLFWGIGGSSHVALYLGDGTMLEAPQSGDVVKVSPVRWDGIEPMAVRMIE